LRTLTLFAVRTLPIDSPARLFRMGFLANVMNPKVAMFNLLFPLFTHPECGFVLWQSAALDEIQILISGLLDRMLVLGAASITAVLARSARVGRRARAAGARHHGRLAQSECMN